MNCSTECPVASFDVIQRLVALETTVQHLATRTDSNAETAQRHVHELREQNTQQELRIYTLENRHEERFRQLEHKVYMALGGLAVFQFVVGVVLALYLKK